jgi:hypothetical protein
VKAMTNQSRNYSKPAHGQQVRGLLAILPTPHKIIPAGWLPT